ncbi:MAG: twin-arginine translocase subunit TatC [Alphaproteobacteria bacterium]|nr:twin-arginine translocase subunit TatC [Alphaproteobacteria bacterium]
MSEAKMTLLQHFVELRRRLIWCLVWFCAAFGLGWFLAPYIQEFLTRPLLSVWSDGGKMLYTNVTDGLFIQFSLATLFAIFATVPVLLWHIWAFVAPGLHKPEKQLVAPILILSPVLFLLGAAFAYYFMFPVVFGFFVEMNEAAPVPATFLPVAGSYLSFVVGLLKIFGLAFQLPLVLVLLNRIGILSRAAVVKSRRYAIVGFFIVGAILTPPDIVLQIMLALPLWALFEIAVLFMKKEHRAQSIEHR